MSKKKLLGLAVTLVTVVVTAAVQSGVLQNVCPPPPVCPAASVAPAPRAPALSSDYLDAGSQ